MSTNLPITADNVRNLTCLPKILGDNFDENFKKIEPHLEKMASPAGMSVSGIADVDTRVHVGWSYGTDQKIDGLIFSIYKPSKNTYDSPTLKGFKITKESKNCERFSAISEPGEAYTQHHVQHANMFSIISLTSSSEFFGLFIDPKPSDKEITFDANWLDTSEKIREFYKDNGQERILDNLLKCSPKECSPKADAPTEKVEGSTPEKEVQETTSGTSRMRQYVALGGALLLLLAVAYYVQQQGPFSTSA
ncbi:hypothetical protein [Simkania sp.]|uniref:hypothetical protein n=1 Tax=Simkania sp. TaxID=34094 RepID=UPI003B51BD00